MGNSLDGRSAPRDVSDLVVHSGLPVAQAPAVSVGMGSVEVKRMQSELQELRERLAALEGGPTIIADSPFRSTLPVELREQLEPLYAQDLPWKRTGKTKLVEGRQVPLIERDMDAVAARQDEVVRLGSVVSLRDYERVVYIDVGARTPGSSVIPFVASYPWQGRTVDMVYAWEADKRFWPMYTADRFDVPVTLIQAAAALHNGTVSFSPINMGFVTEDEQPAGGGSNDEGRVPALDFISWLQARVTKDDFVVMKMDIESSEWDILSKMLSTHTLSLIDELFVECHHWAWNRPAILSSKSFTRSMCVDLVQQLRRYTFAHEWY